MFQVELFILMLMFLVYFITLYILKRNKNGIKLKYKIDSDLNNVDNYKITIFVPARNEQYSIGKTLECLSKLKSNNYKVVIIDDHSTDNTAIEIEKKKNLFKSDQLIIFTPPEPAKGWLGKTNALNKATSMHKSSNADFFLFIDADVHVKNDILQKLVYIQQKEKADMVSINPFFTSNSFWTKIMSAPIMLMLVLSI